MEKRLSSCKHRPVQAACSGTLRFALAASLFTLVGCSQVPDEINPVEWYKGVDAWLGDDESYAEAPPSALESTLERERVVVADEPFPNLSDVPARPPAYDPESAAEISEGLVADRAHAKYSDESIRFQSEANTTLEMQKRQLERRLAEAPPPQASPSAPVTLARAPAIVLHPLAAAAAPRLATKAGWSRCCWYARGRPSLQCQHKFAASHFDMQN